MNCRPACLTLSLLLLGAGTIPAQAVPTQRVPISASAIHDVLILDAEYPTPRDFASFAYVSQVQQAEAIRTTAEHWIGFDDLDVQLSDNSFDLLPGTPLTVEVKGSATRAKLERNLKVMSLRDAFDQAAFSASNSKNLMREPAK